MAPVMVDGRHKATDRGTWYSARLGDEILLESTTEPFYNVSRVLHSRGITGEFGMWVAGKLRMTGNIGHSSEKAVTENAKHFALKQFKEFQWGSDD